MIAALGILALVLFGYFGVPLFVWAVGSLVIAFLGGGFFFLAVAIISGLFLLPPFRKNILSKAVMSFIIKKNLVPAVSETEEIALRAGTNWIETDLFSGKPDFKKIFKEEYPELSADEKAFMENQVEKVCAMANDWEIFQKRDLPPEVWEYLRKEKFLGMVISKQYGGLGFSALGHSAVVHKLATRSQVLAITTMVPNSLGPGELISHYGTQEQKDYYLPRLADGTEIPCFGLTEPNAGSDAASIKSKGEVFKDEAGNIKIRLNFKKRYITLGAVSTIIGLAFRLYDPQNILGKGTDLGITCALVPFDAPGVKLGRRHDPMGVPFVNSPINGENVELGIEYVIGGMSGVGIGWKMLMECLAVGRGISLPSTSAGGAKLISRVMSNYCSVRKQFGLSIGKFEAIEEPLARVAGFTYMIEAMRKFVAGAVNRGEKPAVTNAIAKYHATEKFREIVNDGMDVLAGAAIIRGPRNLMAHAYYGVPVGITVEGANIMTRGLIMFGQGAVRCHPYSYNEMKALMNKDLNAFDHNFWNHAGHLIKNSCRATLLFLTRGYIHMPATKSKLGKRYERKLVWSSAKFAVMADLALAMFGASVKRRETINGRFGDMLSYMLMATCILRRYEAEGSRAEDKIAAEWGIQYCLSKVQTALVSLYENMHPLFKYVFAPLARINPIGLYPSDKLGSKLAVKLLEDDQFRNNLTDGVYYPKDANDALARLEAARDSVIKAEALMAKIKTAIKAGTLPKGRADELIDAALKANVITTDELNFLNGAKALWLDAIMVDAFELTDYASYKMEHSV